jgi:hypothetical protein
VNPDQVSIRGDAIEMRVPAGSVSVAPAARLALVVGDQGYEGALGP